MCDIYPINSQPYLWLSQTSLDPAVQDLVVSTISFWVGLTEDFGRGLCFWDGNCSALNTENRGLCSIWLGVQNREHIQVI